MKNTHKWCVFLSKDKAAKTAWWKTFGANVRRERVMRNVTQEELAEMANLSTRGLQKIERGEMNTLGTTISRLQKALGCSWEKLMP